MIRLDIEKYCENCPDFEPSVYKYSYENGDMRQTDDVYETVISCEYKTRCHSIAKYMKMRNEHRWGSKSN